MIINETDSYKTYREWFSEEHENAKLLYGFYI